MKLIQPYLFVILLLSSVHVSAQNVGIGTTTPSRTLTVKNSSAIANAVVAELASGIGDPGFHLVTAKGGITNDGDSIVTKIGLLYGEDGANLNSFLRFHRGGGAIGSAPDY